METAATSTAELREASAASWKTVAVRRRRAEDARISAMSALSRESASGVRGAIRLIKGVATRSVRRKPSIIITRAWRAAWNLARSAR